MYTKHRYTPSNIWFTYIHITGTQPSHATHMHITERSYTYIHITGTEPSHMCYTCTHITGTQPSHVLHIPIWDRR